MAFMRIRRFKSAFVVAIFLVIAIYHFTSLGGQEDELPIQDLKNDPPPLADLSELNSPADGLVESAPSGIPLPPIAPINRPKLPTPPATPPKDPSSTVHEKDKETAEDVANSTEAAPAQDDGHAPEKSSKKPSPQTSEKAAAKPSDKSIGDDTEVAQPKPSNPPKVLPKPREHWKKEPVHFPLPLESIIPLPTGKPIDIPQIQASFAPEDASSREKRLERRKAVKDAFQISWGVYKVEAWGHDEVLPVSGGFKDPFGGWGASLVDALDTLWIMGLRDEFDQAVKQVAKIDFLTTTMSAIQVFETTIRYIGGLVAAYDISEHQYPILLQKAIEIADVVYGSFDTQNRMPQLQYRWKERQRKTPATGGTSAIMAEIGSLTLEFTRLAQITGNDTYYDAVARITNALDDYQWKTTSPGMWPISADATNCKRRAVEQEPLAGEEVEDMLSGTTPAKSESENAQTIKFTKGDDADEAEDLLSGTTPATNEPESVQKMPSMKADDAEDVAKDERLPLRMSDKTYDPVKRDLNGIKIEVGSSSSSSIALDKKASSKSIHNINTGICEARLQKGWGLRTEEYGLGALIDSLYEYLLKEYLLLGGVGAAGDQYKRLYTSSMEKVTQKLLFRPEVPGNPDVLLSGQYKAGPDSDVLKGVSSHLQCFAGGMFAMGSRVFNNHGDLKTGSKLTDGCVWAYGATRSGIMPEYFSVNRCFEPDNCKFNETEWLLSLVPPDWEPDAPEEIQFTGGRGKFEPEQPTPPTMEKPKKVQSRLVKDENSGQALPTTEPRASPKPATASKDKVKGDDKDEPKKKESASDTKASSDEQVKKSVDGEDEEDEQNEDENGLLLRKRVPTPILKERGSPERIIEGRSSHGFTSKLEWAKGKVKTRGIPPGFRDIGDARYILRPEAIESVWYMYRITGDREWQEKGWKMWNAVNNNTLSDLAHSAIQNVNKKKGEDGFSFRDEMESFWFGETLKYFYLLFSEPDLISLDEWVLNTEAHPFKRPIPGSKETKPVLHDDEDSE